MEEFTVREGTVMSVEPASLIVRLEKEEDCGGCRSCAVRGLCRGQDAAHMDIAVRRSGSFTAARGDRVKVAYRGANPALAALIMFIPALAGLVLGGFAANHFWRAGDGIFLAGCLVGVIAGVTLTLALSRIRSLRPEARLLSSA